MAKSEQDLSADVEALKADMARVREDLGSLTDDLIREGRTQARRAREQVRSGYEHGVDAVSECMQERPISTLLVAAAAGLILGKLLSR